MNIWPFIVNKELNASLVVSLNCIDDYYTSRGFIINYHILCQRVYKNELWC